jgi:RNA polymerase sigma-70 factor (ECF subfamily)
MSSPDSTRHSLLARLADRSDAAAWTTFVALYSPLIQRCLSRYGLQEADAADVSQNVLARVVEQIQKFKVIPGGSFRGWLRTLTFRAFVDSRRSEADDLAAGGSAATHFLGQVPDRHDDAEWWDREYEACLLRWAADQVRSEFDPRHYDAFRLTYLDGLTLVEAGGRLGVSFSAVSRWRDPVFDRVAALVRETAGELR